MKISISIVVYKPEIKLLCDVIARLRKSVSRLRECGHIQVCLDIINNNPHDDTFLQLKAQMGHAPENDKLPVTLTESPGNIGYGAANNISIKKHTGSDYHLVLNPDVFLESDTLFKAVEFMEANPQVGLLTPKVVGFDGEIHYLCKRNSTLLDMFLRSFAPRFIKRIFAERMAEFLMLDQDYENIISPVQYPSGCFMFFRGDILRKINGFDEWFFMYLEDADIGRRILQLADVTYVPSVVIHHQWARGTHNSLRLRLITVVSALKYWYKWGGIFSSNP